MFEVIEKYLVIIACVILGCALLCALIAGLKRRNIFGWFFCGLFFNVIALLIVLCVSVKEKKRKKGKQKKGLRYRHPYLMEEIWKLYYLFNAGALTEEEFDKEKDKLLNY